MNMNVTLESIDNGFVVCGPQYGPMIYRGNYTFDIPKIGTSRSYFPTLELAIEKLRSFYQKKTKMEGIVGDLNEAS